MIVTNYFKQPQYLKYKLLAPIEMIIRTKEKHYSTNITKNFSDTLRKKHRKYKTQAIQFPINRFAV